jgi:peptidoglycan/LPS O-acetylase OafA/YrhL
MVRDSKSNEVMAEKKQAPIPTPKAKLPSVDGWRALSISMVMAAHSSILPGYPSPNLVETFFPFFFDGNLGVRFFFVISGFLITYLLIQEHDLYGRVSLKGFYIRRALRILPVYFAYLAVIALLQIFTNLHQAAITWVGDLTFTTNFLPRGVISGHLWSLSVEEQFYLLWPLTFVWLIKREKYLLPVLVLPMMVALFCHVVSWAQKVPWIIHPLFHIHSSLVNFDSLATGSLAAFALARHREKLVRWLAGWGKFYGVVLGVGLVVLPGCDVGCLRPLTAIAGNLGQAFGFAMLLLASTLYPATFRPLNWSWVTRLGVISYSVYIWQQIFFAGPKTYGFAPVWWMAFPGWLAASLVLGFASYYGLEKPLLKLRAGFRRA